MQFAWISRPQVLIDFKYFMGLGHTCLYSEHTPGSVLRVYSWWGSEDHMRRGVLGIEPWVASYKTSILPNAVSLWSHNWFWDIYMPFKNLLFEVSDFTFPSESGKKLKFFILVWGWRLLTPQRLLWECGVLQWWDPGDTLLSNQIHVSNSGTKTWQRKISGCDPLRRTQLSPNQITKKQVQNVRTTEYLTWKTNEKGNQFVTDWRWKRRQILYLL